MRDIITFLAMILIMLALIFSIDKGNDLSEQLEQKEAKIEALQEENSLLHDEVFNLNKALMKEMEK